MIQLYTPIIFIQGDSYTYTVSFKNIDYSTIDSVVFSCIALDINREMKKDDILETFSYTFDAATTAEWIPLETTYDIKITLEDGTIESQTGIPLIIKKRLNDMDDPEPADVVYWSQLRGIPEAVQSIIIAEVDSDTAYNITKLNHIFFSTAESGLTVGETLLTLANGNSISWTGNGITINGVTHNLTAIGEQVSANSQAIGVLQGKTIAATNSDIDSLFDEE